MHIIIDEREIGLYDKCVEFNSIANIRISKRVLALGDVLFETNEGALFSIIERKSVSDLIASIKDGRYDEQSHRLAHNGECSLHNVVYIIEGMPSIADKKLVFSCIASLNFGKGFSVMRSNSLTDTAEMLIYMADKIERSNYNKAIVNAVSSTSTDQHYCTVVKKVKKENIIDWNKKYNKAVFRGRATGCDIGENNVRIKSVET